MMSRPPYASAGLDGAIQSRESRLTNKGGAVNTYVILRRNGWTSPAELEAAAARSKQVGDERDVRRHPLDPQLRVEEGGGSVGTVCIYQASSEQAIREHASVADLPVDEIIPVVDTVIMREDPVPAGK